MTTPSECCLKIGGDPRTLADYARLRDEMNKLTHPARPDVNWRLAEKLCLSLFEHNGVELQTAAWYTLVRTHLAGLYGMNEGLAILVALVSRQWGNMWPQPTTARIKILSSLSQRLQQAMRTLSLTYIDLSQLYQAEAHLTALDDVLQRLELKHAGQLDALSILLHNAAVRLESSENKEETAPQAAAPDPAPSSLPEPTAQVKWVYVAEPASRPNADVVTAFPAPAKPWKPFVAGMLTMLALAGAAAGGWRATHPSDSGQMRFPARFSPLPTVLSAEQLQTLRQQSPRRSRDKTDSAAAGAAFTAKTGLGFELWHSSGAAGADAMARAGETAGAAMATAGQRRRASRGESQRLAPGNDAATAVDEPA